MPVLNRKAFINVPLQTLKIIDDGEVIFSTLVSTAVNGTGEKQGSECTPRGKHIIRAKIGKDCAENTVFRGRRPTGEIFTKALQKQQPNRDWILTRILWLSGCEVGVNRLGSVDTMRRYIYLHGCPDDVEMGKPASHGCVRMTNQDVVSVFNLLPLGAEVIIEE